MRKILIGAVLALCFLMISLDAGGQAAAAADRRCIRDGCQGAAAG